MTSSYIAGVKAARQAVARQTELPDLIHFERPSDFRKGVLTSLAAIDAILDSTSGNAVYDDDPGNGPIE